VSARDVGKHVKDYTTSRLIRRVRNSDDELNVTRLISYHFKQAACTHSLVIRGAHVHFAFLKGSRYVCLLHTTTVRPISITFASFAMN
jgi:hypothetical protein